MVISPFHPAEFVRLSSHATSAMEFEAMSKWIRTLLQWGADPDLEPYPSEPIICHCQSSIFLKKLGTQPLCHLIHEVCMPECLYVWFDLIFYVPVCLSVCLYTSLPSYLLACLPACLSFWHLSFFLLLWLLVYLSVCLHVCLFDTLL